MRFLFVCLCAIFVLQAGHASATTLTYGTTNESASGPTYPTTPVGWDVFHPTFTGAPPSPIHSLSMGLVDVQTNPANGAVPILMSASHGTDADDKGFGFVEMYSGEELGAIFPTETVFNALFEIGQTNEQEPMLFPPDPVNITDTSFEIMFDVGVHGGMARHTFLFEIGENADMQPLVFDQVMVSGPNSPSFNVSWVLLNPTGQAVHMEAPLMTVTMTGHFIEVIPEPATMTLMGLGLAGFALRRRKRASL